MKPFALLDRLLFRLARKGPRTGPRQGVLLLAAGGLGDAVLLMAVLDRFLPLAAKGEQVTLLMRQDAAKMGFLAPPEIELLSVDFSRLGKETDYRLKTFRSLAERGFRLAVSLDYLRHPHLDEALIRAADARENLAMQAKPWAKHQAALDANRSLYARLYDSGPALSDKVMRWAGFAEWLTGRKLAPPTLALAEARLPPPEAGASPRVFIQPFSAVKSKQCPPGFYLPLLEALPSTHAVSLLGAPADLERNQEFKSLLERPNVSFDARPFKDLLPALRAASLVVSVDTALMHLAALSGAPTLCLASAAYAGEIVPYPAETCPATVRFLMTGMECQGCLGVCTWPGHDTIYPCVAKLDAQEAARLALELMEEFA
ncbi:MAG: lipopolysaccharide heptosyltransferase family protein [Rhodospirillales bacterium]|nr:MAG: lipopolysaccharide heptosyltransferase family protein [Rhodospirillales bacterium]